VLNANAIEDVDRRSVFRVRLAVAAVVGAQKSRARLVKVPERNAARKIAPRFVSEANAFSFGAAGARDAERVARSQMIAVGVPCTGHGKTKLISIWVGITYVRPLVRIIVGRARQSVERDLGIARVVLDAIDAQTKAVTRAAAEHENGADETFLAEHLAALIDDAEFGADHGDRFYFADDFGLYGMKNAAGAYESADGEDNAACNESSHADDARPAVLLRRQNDRVDRDCVERDRCALKRATVEAATIETTTVKTTTIQAATIEPDAVELNAVQLDAIQLHSCCCRSRNRARHDERCDEK
jgi:hypothetical protein